MSGTYRVLCLGRDMGVVGWWWKRHEHVPDSFDGYAMLKAVRAGAAEHYGVHLGTIELQWEGRR